MSKNNAHIADLLASYLWAKLVPLNVGKSEVLCGGASAGNIEYSLCDTQFAVKQYNGLENTYLAFSSKAGIIESGNKAGGT